MIKAIIFDIDNTLIDFVERKKLVIIESVKAMIDAGLDEDFKKLHKEFSDFYWKNGIENQKIFEKFLKSKYNKVDYRVLARAIVTYRAANNGLLRSYPGAKTVLITLKERGFKLAVLSDAPRVEAYIRLCVAGLDDFFDVILTKDDVKRTKPNSRGFKMAAKRLKVNLDECAMVGDNLSRDISGTKQLGMRTVLAKYGLVQDHSDNQIKAQEAQADFVAERIQDLIDIFDKINK